jgi:hypothetical protein
MRTVFINSGLDDFLSKKIQKGRIHDNVQEGLPTRKVEVKPLYKALEMGSSLLTGFKMPSQQEEELRKALSAISKVVESIEKERESIVTEDELIAALDMLDDIAKSQR